MIESKKSPLSDAIKALSEILKKLNESDKKIIDSQAPRPAGLFCFYYHRPPD